MHSAIDEFKIKVFWIVSKLNKIR